MKDFSGKTAIVTGGGSGIGRSLVAQLASEGCSVAMCDINEEDMQESQMHAMKTATQGVKVSTYVADVADAARIDAFREHVCKEHEIDHIHLLINNAGVGGGGSIVTNEDPQGWDRTFNICWYGVLNNVRTFMPMVVAADEGHIVNVSSVNGFWATIGPETPHTAYCASKFAVKGFTEALITDLAINAPHVKASVVCPGYIGTNIIKNSWRVHGSDLGGQATTEEEVDEVLNNWTSNAITTPDEAAKVILDGVKANNWRILIGPDAHALDEAVRQTPLEAYEPDFAMKAFEPFAAAIEAVRQDD